jgi:periplasmic mercuric ion binding protein
MKKISLFFLLVAGISTTALSQQKKPLTVKISTPGAKCEDCKKRIEDYLKYEDGITTVTYLQDRTNIENIKTAIANVGYDADDVKANEESYKRLPKGCKKPEDGGHPKKP